MGYATIQRLMKRTAKRAGITKRVHPHLLRHSRITHVLANGFLNEAQAKVYFGLVADSKMLATYSHLLSRDSNDAVLRMYGITPSRDRSESESQRCDMCGEHQEQGVRFCSRCGAALTIDAANEAATRTQKAEDRVTQFLQRPGVRELFKKMLDDERSDQKTNGVKNDSDAP